MTITAASLRLRLGGISTTILDADSANECLADALLAVGKKYGEPYSVIFQTVADQQEYALPDMEEDGDPVDIRSITDIVWHPGGSPDTIDTDVIVSMPEGNSSFNRTLDPTNLTLNDLHKRFLINKSRGRWRRMNGKIWLDPVPDSDDLDVMVLYRRMYASTDDIPTELEDRFWLVAVASALERMALTDAPIIEIYEGTQKIRLDGGRTYLKQAAALRERFEGGL